MNWRRWCEWNVVRDWSIQDRKTPSPGDSSKEARVACDYTVRATRQLLPATSTLPDLPAICSSLCVAGPDASRLWLRHRSRGGWATIGLPPTMAATRKHRRPRKPGAYWPHGAYSGVPNLLEAREVRMPRVARATSEVFDVSAACLECASQSPLRVGEADDSAHKCGCYQEEMPTSMWLWRKGAFPKKLDFHLATPWLLLNSVQEC